MILQRTLPPKVEDLGSFTIPCNIGNLKIGKALIDLGSNINLMPLTVLKKIGDLEVKPTRMSLLMAYGSPKRPYGMVEDVMVRVANLMFMVDFVILEMEENAEIPIIVGRSFMKMAKVIINVHEGTIALKDQEEDLQCLQYRAASPSKDNQSQSRI
ncbi:uncharacterized protein LOC106779681 [Vigna radiata var. radiata]|uniref:Uncharacterized protein LOC106779681 n=1 Tax=Vigna radiata var. radiata TaxID=3916 RepID=A0A1S3VYA8_VIGRR|nr:uncharacterized protein LOC106779681 [Vigna radiata var. radiata]